MNTTSATDGQIIARLLHTLRSPDALLPSETELPEYRQRVGVFIAPYTEELATAQDEQEEREIVHRLLHIGSRFCIDHALVARHNGEPDVWLEVRFHGCGCMHLLYLSECCLLEGDDHGE
jgi:hypothetical protein